MPRLIDANKLMEYIESAIGIMTKNNIQLDVDGLWQLLNHAVNTAQTIDPVKHGHWISVSQTKLEKLLFPSRVFKCSVCGNYLDFDGVDAGRGSANFCPNCGVEMGKVKNETN